MQRNLLLVLALGFLICCVGLFARIYMDFVFYRSNFSGANRGRSTELRYMRLIKENGVPKWPLFVAVTCVPLGIVTCVGAILYNNHLRLPR
jgi:formate hydrogenlyase subunit 3/multisubunit Na+/H+ antiporter MnhD subunit